MNTGHRPLWKGRNAFWGYFFYLKASLKMFSHHKEHFWLAQLHYSLLWLWPHKLAESLDVPCAHRFFALKHWKKKKKINNLRVLTGPGNRETSGDFFIVLQNLHYSLLYLPFTSFGFMCIGRWVPFQENITSINIYHFSLWLGISVARVNKYLLFCGINDVLLHCVKISISIRWFEKNYKGYV